MDTNGDAVAIIENEGLAYAVRHYTDGAQFKDPHTGTLWDAAALALDNLIDYLEAETGQEIDA
jgi:hypothetical protein